MCFTCGLFEVRRPLLGWELRRTGAGCTLFCLLRPAPRYGKGELGTAGVPHDGKKQRLVWVAWSRLGGAAIQQRQWCKLSRGSRTGNKVANDNVTGAQGLSADAAQRCIGVQWRRRCTACAVVVAVNAVQWCKWRERGMGTGSCSFPAPVPDRAAARNHQRRTSSRGTCS